MCWPPALVCVIEGLAEDWRRLDERIGYLSDEIAALARQDAGCERLVSVPGIGPIISSAMVAAIGNGDGFLFVQAAWVTLVKVSPNRWEGHGLKPWIETAKKRLHHNVLANKLARNRMERASSWSRLRGEQASGGLIIRKNRATGEHKRILRPRLRRAVPPKS